MEKRRTPCIPTVYLALHQPFTYQTLYMTCQVTEASQKGRAHIAASILFPLAKNLMRQLYGALERALHKHPFLQKRFLWAYLRFTLQTRSKDVFLHFNREIWDRLYQERKRVKERRRGYLAIRKSWLFPSCLAKSFSWLLGGNDFLFYLTLASQLIWFPSIYLIHFIYQF